YSKVGDVITYSIKVTNVGNVTLTNVEVTDNNADETQVGMIASLVPNASETFTAEHTVTQADLDAGAVYNIATAKGKDPKGGDVEDDSEDDNPMDPNDPNYPGTDPNCVDCTITVIDQAGELEVIKTTDRTQTYSKVGDVITYTTKVTHVGNVTLTDVNVTDSNADNTAVGTIASLEPGASESFMAEHTVTQADLDAGAVYNIATAKGKDP